MARILVLSMHAQPLYAARAMQFGALGYLSMNTSAEELLIAVQRVWRAADTLKARSHSS